MLSSPRVSALVMLACLALVPFLAIYGERLPILSRESWTHKAPR